MLLQSSEYLRKAATDTNNSTTVTTNTKTTAAATTTTITANALCQTPERRRAGGPEPRVL